jgi:two-component system, chemotaxis family, sensor kinase CheA
MSLGEMKSALAEFTLEGAEILQRVNEGLHLIEKGKVSSELYGSLYRDIHTLKGTAQLFGFQEMGRVAHTLEASLDPIRKQNLSVTPRLLDSCLKGLDLLDRMLHEITTSQSDKGHQQEVLEVVSALVDSVSNQFHAELELTKDDLIADQAAFIDQKKTEGPVPRKPIAENLIEVPEFYTNLTDPSTSVFDASIRVPVSLLDGLMNLVGELVLVRNQFLQYRNNNEAAEFLGLSKNLDVVTSELQSEVMKTRMQPIGNVVSKFQRVVRDIAKDLGKRIDLTLEGADTELDKTLLEAIKDPLTHLVRNSCDHGIENVAERKIAGKPETGHLLIRSFHEGGQVVIEISDDGKGIDRSKILARAIERGILKLEQSTRLQDREICNLIFTPGFSTAKVVTSVSGRGVGMDVVKTNIEKIGGTVELTSVFKKGTTIRLKIPLTLAIVPAMLVRSGEERFAIPQVKLVELVRIEGEQKKNGIEYLQNRPMYRLRGALLPLLDIKEITVDPVFREYNEAAYIVVLNAEGEIFGLIVDEILDTADIVVKPLGSFLKHLSVFSGATIMGDGSISLILDVVGMAQAGKIDTKKEHLDDISQFLTSSNAKVSTDIQDFLIFSLETGVVHALPLCLVQRLEEFRLNDVERSGEQKVVRYRGSLLPLINLKQALKYECKGTNRPNDFVSVIVIQRSGRNYGIEVSEILDVISGDGQIDDSVCDRPGILGNIVFNDSVIVVVDALSLIENSIPQIQRTKNELAIQRDKRSSMDEIRAMNKDFKSNKVRILYAEDVAFFRRHVVKVLSEAGLEISTFEDGLKALQALESAPADRYNLIISDIEMPNMNGLELAKSIRAMPKFHKIPMIALTTKFRDADIEAGSEAGFNSYLEKLNPDKLMDCIEALMGGGKM